MFLKRFLQYNCKTEHSFQLNICLKGLTFPQYEAFQNIWQIINENEIKAPGISVVIMICMKCLLGMAGGMSQTIADTDNKRGQEL